MNNNFDFVRKHITECVLYPHRIVVYRPVRFTDWLEENEIRYIFGLDEYDCAIDIRFKSSVDVTAFKLRFGENP